ncbi:hypothetical protein AKO1_008939 [Acrasis kona]|uniref:EGF-like domain-containing protein n=1 Tax=Acrasis kona TaxID=1008807 RepID=A0AAW2ZGJ4_9EUKA
MCNTKTGTCMCAYGLYGQSCEKICPGGLDNICSGTGQCFDGVCICDSGTFGTSCSLKYCPYSCGAGTCDFTKGLCKCPTGYYGPNCSSLCPGGVDNTCSGHGTCDSTTGVCLCDSKYAGYDCSQLLIDGYFRDGSMSFTVPASGFTNAILFIKEVPDKKLTLTFKTDTGNTSSSRSLRSTFADSTSYSIEVASSSNNTMGFYVGYSATNRPTASNYDSYFMYPSQTKFPLVLPIGQWFLFLTATNMNNTPADVKVSMISPVFDPNAVPALANPSQLAFNFTLEIIILISATGVFIGLFVVIIFTALVLMCCIKGPTEEQRLVKELYKKKKLQSKALKKKQEIELDDLSKSELKRQDLLTSRNRTSTSPAAPAFDRSAYGDNVFTTNTPTSPQNLSNPDRTLIDRPRQKRKRAVKPKNMASSSPLNAI